MLELGLKTLIAYLLGSLMGALLVGSVRGVDIREQGSGNAGGTNALRTQGFWFALGTVVVDVGKGWLAAGWLLVFAASLMIDHFDLFGTRQVWLYLRGRPYTPLPFHTPLLYSRVRHPLYVGWALASWATPTMTLGHLLFAGVLTLYMAIAALIEAS